MAQSPQPAADDRRLLDVLEERPCSFCETGTLERGLYKGNNAVVCDNCGTPRAQLWTPS
ncbi:HVO_A0556 family zinc finger protein [Salinadaptatus halalkaliphilus]|uniref:HVO_A0556 family zinc finger protein n=1 Tax=Salinadaptatus halalkaliphilus TaxID=2419781 RepID=UPI0015809BCE|nr:HVO_A0556 family zinc finger protein [Salinadaptatus halalkaliphilus]